MKTIKRMCILLLMLAVALLMCACELSDKGRTDQGSDTYVSVTEEEPPAEEEPSAAEEEEEPEEEEPAATAEDEDPANIDTTDAVSEANSEDEMKQKYIGTWKMVGLLFWEGSTENAGKCTIKVNEDGTYTMKGTIEGESVDRSGNWSLNSKKKLVLGDDKLGINEDGYLLLYSGQRDGKGNKLNYAFKKKG